LNFDIKLGDALDVLKSMPSHSADRCVTSPPYWSLREYPVTASIWDGEKNCRHRWVKHLRPAVNGKVNGRAEGWLPGSNTATRTAQVSAFCSKCKAWRGQLGLEPTPKMYVAHMVQIFRQVRRVLRPGSALWLNLGDTWYSRAGSGKRMGGIGQMSHYRGLLEDNGAYPVAPPNRMPIDGLKPKDLVGIPWMVAFALRKSGWWLRSEVIWSKPNGMAKVAADRPACIHETIFLLSNARQYFYDHEANLEPSSPSEINRRLKERANGKTGNCKIKRDDLGMQPAPGKTSILRSIDRRIELAIGGLRRRRSIWEIPCTKWSGTHSSTFPIKIADICIQCGTPEGATVLDPFCGTGTVGVAALRKGRKFIGIDLDPQSAQVARSRIANDAPLFNTPANVKAISRTTTNQEEQLRIW
jgi:DNA modification methylase